MAIVPQVPQGVTLFSRKNSVGDSDVIENIPLLPTKFDCTFYNSSSTDTATLYIYGGDSSSPASLLNTMTFSAGDRREKFVSIPYNYYKVTVGAINNPNAYISVVADSVEA